MNTYLVRSYFLSETKEGVLQPNVQEFIVADEVVVDVNGKVVFQRNGKNIASFDLSIVYFIKQLINEESSEPVKEEKSE